MYTKLKFIIDIINKKNDFRALFDVFVYDIGIKRADVSRLLV